jgi:hypothetical protein
MTPLARLQRGFQHHVLEGNPRFEHKVHGTARASAARRLGIYSGAYRARLVEALGKDYPGLRALAGVAQFKRLARDYIAAHPSRFSNLRWYGGELAAFLETSPHRRATALAEMAAFEWELGIAFDAADAHLLMLEDIVRVPPEAWPHMRFKPHPSVRRLSLRYNVPAFRVAADDSAPLPPLRRARAPVAWLIWRQDLTARFRSLEGDEARALDALMRGADFGEICAQLADTGGPALRAAALLKRWVADVLLTAQARN